MATPTIFPHPARTPLSPRAHWRGLVAPSGRMTDRAAGFPLNGRSRAGIIRNIGGAGVRIRLDDAWRAARVVQIWFSRTGVFVGHLLEEFR